MAFVIPGELSDYCRGLASAVLVNMLRCMPFRTTAGCARPGQCGKGVAILQGFTKGTALWGVCPGT